MSKVKNSSVLSDKKSSRAGHRFGSHLSIAGGMHHAIQAALRLKFDTVQVFVKNQRRWRAAALKDDDLEQWHALLQTPGFGPPVAHATYLINLASGDGALFEKSCEAFSEELRRCDRLAIPYLVVHPGAAGEQKQDVALARVAEALNLIFDKHPDLGAMPLLETTAGQGTSLGHSFGELGAIIDAVQEPERIGVCVDTCHVFAAGYDIRAADGYAAMMREAERSVGLKRIRCWHLNDSKRELGSRVDRHEHIGRGAIGAAGFGNVLGDAQFVGTPMILETPKELNAAGQSWDVVNRARLRSIATRMHSVRAGLRFV